MYIAIEICYYLYEYNIHRDLPTRDDEGNGDETKKKSEDIDSRFYRGAEECSCYHLLPSSLPERIDRQSD